MPLALLVTLTACGGPIPGGEPTVVGVVADGPALAEPSDEYFEGMSLLTEDTVVVGPDDESLPRDALVTGARVEVWTGEACAESYPVQCDVLVVRVLETTD